MSTYKTLDVIHSPSQARWALIWAMLSNLAIIDLISIIDFFRISSAPEASG